MFNYPHKKATYHSCMKLNLEQNKEIIRRSSIKMYFEKTNKISLNNKVILLLSCYHYNLLQLK